MDYIVKLKASGSNDSITEYEAVVGEKIISQKTNVQSIYLIKNGLAKCYLTEDTGNDFIQEFFGAGEVFGEIELITNEISFCTIEALAPTTYFKIPKKTFNQLLKEDAVFNTLLLQLMASKIKYTALRHSYNQSHAIEKKLRKLLNELPNLFQKISKNDIANYLGITVRSLNRVLPTLDTTPTLHQGSSSQ
ncbi:Crp/Fnr family transcriptional regulator [Croceitalea rosinachiae]|uniref:Crp/Fnr family transcriptional regulator n=1 Tax=Croceitalea rosinachiae TaxID=3075596 RepID=A0ABU3AAB2_9FLAO|nr:Crp/Fnr family transcriptional regulator [Croceitalea sp. F388]MDT0605998.1 Crp/Fnr family transcriptional regulator [Croceitalea sp. F388]